jgi:hypothetical protein
VDHEDTDGADGCGRYRLRAFDKPAGSGLFEHRRQHLQFGKGAMSCNSVEAAKAIHGLRSGIQALHEGR